MPKALTKVVPEALTEIVPDALTKKKYKQKIPKAVREQLWLRDMGRIFEGKCNTVWCKNTVSLFDFQCGHNIPESKGGPLTLENLVVICGRCNTSMGNQYTFSEWSSSHSHEPLKPLSLWKRLLCRYF